VQATTIPNPTIEGYRLSVQQSALWKGGNAASHWSQCAILVSGPTDLGRLRRAIAAIVDRHEILRTAFPQLPGMDAPVQAVESTMDVVFEVDEMPAPWSEGALLGEQGCPCDLVGREALRCRIVRADNANLWLLLALPSLRADRHTVRNLATEIAIDYGRGDSDDASDERIQYSHVSEWQHELLAEDGARQRVDYWVREIEAAGFPTVLPGERSPSTGRIAILRGRVAPASEDHLFAAFQALVGRRTARQRFSLMLGCSGRSIPELRNQIGPLERKVPVAVELTPEMPFSALVRVSSAKVREAQAQQEYYASETLPEDGIGFEYEQWPEEYCAAGVRFRLAAVDTRCRFKLTLIASRTAGGLRLELQYDRGVYGEREIRWLLEAYQAVLAEAVAEPERPIGELPMMGGEERAVLQEWGRGREHGVEGGCIHERIAMQAASRPDTTALEYEDHWLSYGELEARGNRLARGLQELRVGPEQPVGICLDRSVEQVIGLIGVLKSGGVCLPLDPDQPEERLCKLVRDSGAPAVVTQERWKAKLGGATARLLCVDSELADSAEPVTAAVDASNAAYIIYTSGSMGEPKGVLIEHRSVSNLLQALREAVHGDSSGAAVGMNAPVSFDASVKQWIQLAEGHRLHIVPERVRRDAEALGDYLLEKGIEVIDCTPSQVSMMHASGKALSARRALVGGEAIEPELWAELSGSETTQYYNVYGPTECTVDATATRVRGKSGIGRPLSNTQVYVLDERMDLCAAGQQGELCIGGSGVGRGYLGKGDRTAERFVPNPFGRGSRLYRTGDRVRWNEEGQLEFLGRIDGQIKIRGYRIEPGEIEAAMRRLPGVRDALVVAREKDGDRRLVGYWIPQTRPDEPGRRLPNGMVVADCNRNETEYLFDEIFTKRTYLRNGISLPESAVILDIGANIGMFSLFIANEVPDARLYAFEPIPDLFSLCQSNMIRYAPAALLFDYGLSDSERMERFTFYPRYSMMSGAESYAAAESDVEVIKKYLLNSDEAGHAGAHTLLEDADELLAGRFDGQLRECRVRRLSDVIREQHLLHIDLVKIDVQRAELDVLRGLDDCDWEKIDQFVVEAHDGAGQATEGRIADIARILDERGFDVTAEQDNLMRGTDRFNVYARRRRLRAYERRQSTVDVGQRVNRSADLLDGLRQILPAYMVPSAMVAVSEWPLSKNGKVDRAKLSDLEDIEGSSGRQGTGPEARTPTEEVVAGIWREVLGRQTVGVDDNFFDLGGHSLLATQVVSRVRDAFSVTVPLRTLFERPTVANLAEAINHTLRANAGTILPPIVPANRDSALPLSFAQQRLWFLHQLEPNSPAYNCPAAVRLEGELNVDALNSTLSEIIRRHEILRTCYPAVRGSGEQRILPPVALAVPVVDLAYLGRTDAEKAVERWTAQESRRPFELASQPPIRFALLRLGASDHVLVFTAHHIASDGWSIGILVREVAALYDSFACGESLRLPELDLQYADFAGWQRDWLSGPRMETHLSWWREQMQGDLPTLKLPADSERAQVSSHRGARESVRIPAELAVAVKRVSQQEGATLFMTLLAAYAALLYRYSSQTDILIGCPIGNRTRTEVEPLIGFFVNTLVMRIDLSGNPSFRELLHRVREVALGAYTHQDLPFERLVSEVNPDREPGRSPLFQAMFTLQNNPQETLKLRGLTLRPSQNDHRTAKFDLNLVLGESTDRIVGSLEYNADLFSADRMRDMVETFIRLVNGAVEDPDARIGELPVVCEIASATAAIEAPAVETITEALRKQVEEAPDAISVRSEAGFWTYEELAARSNRIARALQALGVTRETAVGVCMVRSFDGVAAIVGAINAGGYYVPIDPEYPVERIEYMIRDAGVQAVVTDDRCSAHLPSGFLQILSLDSDAEFIGAQSNLPLDDSNDPEQVAYAIYTSGSTGKPKGVMCVHRSVVNLAAAQGAAFQVSRDSIVFQFASYSFDASVAEIFVTLLRGASLWLGTGVETGADLPRILQEHCVTTATLPPSLLGALPDADLPVLSTLIVAGEQCASGTAARWSRGRRFLNAYGPTETTVCATVGEGFDGLAQPHIGKAIANVSLHVLNAHMSKTPYGVVGELYVGGAGVSCGYVGMPDATAERFVPDPFSSQPGARLYRTGDLTSYRPDGNLMFHGRVDSQLKIRGFRVEPGEVEAVLARHPGVREAVAVGVADESGHKLLAAYYVPTGDALDPEVLRLHIGNTLPEYMIPALFIDVDEFPKNRSGKIDRSALRDPRAGFGVVSAEDEPTTEVERELARIWAEVLGRDNVGLHDNFFHLGGDSILSIQIVARACEAGLQLAPAQIFERQTIAKLAEVLGETEAAPEPATSAGDVPLTPIQHWFFEQDLPNPHHYNQSILLDANQPLDVAILRRCMAALWERHDALRMRFEKHGDEWRQRESLEFACSFTFVELSRLAPEKRKPALEASFEQVQRSLNLSFGPLFRIVLFEGGPSGGRRLFIVVHHLAVDAVSWRVLLHDLQTAYNQMSDGKQTALGTRSTSFSVYARALERAAVEGLPEAERLFWESMTGLAGNVARIPVDTEGGLNTDVSTQAVTVFLPERETRILLEEAPRRFNARMSDALLAALLRAMSRWTGETDLIVDLEGHGREPISSGIDLTRAVGWFTSVFPIYLRAEAGSTAEEVLLAVKERLRAVPRNGIGYGMLRYLRPSAELKLRAEISFNYLGQLDSVVGSSGPFVRARESRGTARDRGGLRPHLLAINSSVNERRLHMAWSYSANVYRRDTIERIAGFVLDALGEIALCCTKKQDVTYTPSDFPLSGLDQAALQRMVAKIRSGDQ
jgi:amino acid adenylation domain-containing protein/non-ribosomal peptide synthase protein (TIGR01720 family)/FkbM family methyltransferase